jgi:polyphosphate kinase
MVPIDDPDAVAQLEEILAFNVADDVQAWSLASDGTWHRIPTVTKVSAQQSLQATALARNLPHDEVLLSWAPQERNAPVATTDRVT